MPSVADVLWFGAFMGYGVIVTVAMAIKLGLRNVAYWLALAAAVAVPLIIGNSWSMAGAGALGTIFCWEALGLLSKESRKIDSMVGF